jgi:hypothetical protein
MAYRPAFNNPVSINGNNRTNYAGHFAPDLLKRSTAIMAGLSCRQELRHNPELKNPKRRLLVKSKS